MTVQSLLFRESQKGEVLKIPTLTYTFGDNFLHFISNIKYFLIFYLLSSYHQLFFFFLPNLFWVVITSFWIPCSLINISSSWSKKAPCTITYFPAFFPGKFWRFTLQANFCCSMLAKPCICSSTSFFGTMNNYSPIIFVIFLLLAFSAMICIPLNVPSLKIYI